jgi:hypothetical protein
MNDTIVPWLSNLWSQFLILPTEWKVLLGVGVLASFGAAKTLWKLSYPIRWIVALVFLGLNHLVAPRKKEVKTEKPKETDKPTTIVVGNEPPVFDITSYEQVRKLLIFYAYTPEMLSDAQLDLLTQASTIYDRRIRRDDNASNLVKFERLIDREASNRAEVLKAKRLVKKIQMQEAKKLIKEEEKNLKRTDIISDKTTESPSVSDWSYLIKGAVIEGLEIHKKNCDLINVSKNSKDWRQELCQVKSTKCNPYGPLHPNAFKA